MAEDLHLGTAIAAGERAFLAVYFQGVSPQAARAAAIAAAAPLIAAQVRAQIADDIESRIHSEHRNSGYLDGLRYAAQIARGEA